MMSFLSGQLDDLLANNSVVQDFKKQFESMQALLITLEQRIEELEKTIKTS